MTRPSTAAAQNEEQREPERPARERVVVAGLGRAGLEYTCALAMHTAAEVAGFVEPRSDLRRFARGVGFAAPSEPTLARWLDRRACDTLIVCSPPEDALALVERGVEAGLAILVHGLARMPGEVATRIHAALEGSNRPSAAGSAVLFHPLFARARGSGALSPERVTQVRASASVSRVFSPLAHPGPSDVVSFLLADLMLLLDASFGPIVAVKAGGQKLYGSWLDECQVEARFACGKVAKIEASWSVPDYPGAAMVIECMTDEGRVIVSDDALELETTSQQGRVVAASEPSTALYDGGDASLVVAGFLKTLVGGTAFAEALSVARAARIARVADAVRQSIGTDSTEREVTP